MAGRLRLSLRSLASSCRRSYAVGYGVHDAVCIIDRVDGSMHASEAPSVLAFTDRPSSKALSEAFSLAATIRDCSVLEPSVSWPREVDAGNDVQVAVCAAESGISQVRGITARVAIRCIPA